MDNPSVPPSQNSDNNPPQQQPNHTQVPAGWYPDPTSHTSERWWDGTHWTNQSRNLADLPPPTLPQPPPPHSPHSQSASLTAEELQRLRQHRHGHSNQLCLNCGYQGPVGIARPVRMKWLSPGVIILILVLGAVAGQIIADFDWQSISAYDYGDAAYGALSLTMIAFGLVWAMKRPATFHCPRCNATFTHRRIVGQGSA